jgi:hypothetical protein
MSNKIGPREAMLRHQREAKFAQQHQLRAEALKPPAPPTAAAQPGATADARALPVHRRGIVVKMISTT